MPIAAEPPKSLKISTMEQNEVLLAISRESHQLADQCVAIQLSISAILEIVHRPDLGAEIHMLQDIDRIQQTLSDVAAILQVMGRHAKGPPIGKDEIGSVIRLESLGQRLGLSAPSTGELTASEPSDITWL